MKNFFFLLFLPLMAAIGCDTTKNATKEKMTSAPKASLAKAAARPMKITYKRGPCMGKCPVFTLEIDENGSAILSGKKYARLQGDHIKKISNETLNELHRLFAEADFMSLDDKYDSGILDAPTVTIAAMSERTEKTVSIRGMKVEALQPIIAALEAIYNSDNWVSMSSELIGASRQTFSYSQGPCFGTCPVYTIDIYDGVAVMNGRKYAARQGKYTKKFTEKEQAELAALFNAADWFSLEDSYDDKILDAAQYVLSYGESDMMKLVTFRGRFPQKVKPIAEYFRNLAESEGWTKAKTNEFGLPAGTIANELIVTLKKGNSIEDFVVSYIKQGMKLEKTIVPSLGLYLVSFDPYTMTPQEMLQDVRNRVEVKNVEFNKEVTSRD